MLGSMTGGDFVPTKPGCRLRESAYNPADLIPWFSADSLNNGLTTLSTFFVLNSSTRAVGVGIEGFPGS